MFKPSSLSTNADYALLYPLNQGLIDPDYDANDDHFGLKEIPSEKSLYLRTARLLAWREQALKEGQSPLDIRTLESNVRWPYGRALLPSTEENPLGAPEAFLMDDDLALQEYIELFLQDHLHALSKTDKEAEAPSQITIILANMAGIKDDQTASEYQTEFHRNHADNLARLNTYSDELAQANAFYEIDSHFVGMEPIKNAIWKLYKADRFSAKERLSRASVSMHMAFVGTRGKGKSTVVPAVATALKNLGLLESDHVETISLNKIAGTTLGADDVNLRNAFDRGEKGVVFIDEVDVMAEYLARDHTRSQLSQAINEKMEEWRKHTCVVVASYPEHIDNFLDSDPGLRSRFGDRVIHFPEYTTADLVKMFEIEMKKSGFRVEGDHVRSSLWEHLSDLRKNHHKDFADGRTVREFIQSLQSVLEERLSQTGQSGLYRTQTSGASKIIKLADIKNTIRSMQTSKQPKKFDPFTESNPFKVAAQPLDSQESGPQDTAVVLQLPGRSGPPVG